MWAFCLGKPLLKSRAVIKTKRRKENDTTVSVFVSFALALLVVPSYIPSSFSWGLKGQLGAIALSQKTSMKLGNSQDR